MIMLFGLKQGEEKILADFARFTNEIRDIIYVHPLLIIQTFMT